jgi:hypothetical protein
MPSPHASSPIAVQAVGDLSVKHGVIPMGASTFTAEYQDPALPLLGGSSVVGRSIVLQHHDGSL